MGNNRLGTLPDTRPWRLVVSHIAEGAGAAVVAGATSAAAVRGLQIGLNDRGVARVVYLLAHTVLAARQGEFADRLAALGIFGPPDPGLFDLTAGFTSAMRTWSAASRTPRTDLGEMAILAAAEALTVRVGARVDGLFHSGQEVRLSVRESSTKNGFAALAFEFFTRFTRRFLLYHLGRELSQHVGGSGRFSDHAAHTAFIADLEVHCREAAGIVKVYSGDWYDKARFEDGISAARAQAFAAHCLKKLRGELARRGGIDV